MRIIWQWLCNNQHKNHLKMIIPILNEVIRNEIIYIREYENVISIAQRNNKVDIIEKELIESKIIVQDLRIDAEWVCLEYEKVQNKHSYSEFRYEELVEQLKCELWRVRFKQQEENYLGVEDTMEKIEEECTLELIA